MAKQVKVSYGRTCQSAPYEFIRLDIAIEKDISDDASIKDECDKTVNGLVQYIKSKIADILQNERM